MLQLRCARTQQLPLQLQLLLHSCSLLLLCCIKVSAHLLQQLLELVHTPLALWISVVKLLGFFSFVRGGTGEFTRSVSGGMGKIASSVGGGVAAVARSVEGGVGEVNGSVRGGVVEGRSWL